MSKFDISKYVAGVSNPLLADYIRDSYKTFEENKMSMLSETLDIVSNIDDLKKISGANYENLDLSKVKLGAYDYNILQHQRHVIDKFCDEIIKNSEDYNFVNEKLGGTIKNAKKYFQIKFTLDNIESEIKPYVENPGEIVSGIITEGTEIISTIADLNREKRKLAELERLQEQKYDMQSCLYYHNYVESSWYRLYLSDEIWIHKRKIDKIMANYERTKDPQAKYVLSIIELSDKKNELKQLQIREQSLKIGQASCKSNQYKGIQTDKVINEIKNKINNQVKEINNYERIIAQAKIELLSKLADLIEEIVKTQKNSLADFGINSADELEKLRRSYIDIGKLVKIVNSKAFDFKNVSTNFAKVCPIEDILSQKRLLRERVKLFDQLKWYITAEFCEGKYNPDKDYNSISKFDRSLANRLRYFYDTFPKPDSGFSDFYIRNIVDVEAYLWNDDSMAHRNLSELVKKEYAIKLCNHEYDPDKDHNEICKIDKEFANQLRSLKIQGSIGDAARNKANASFFRKYRDEFRLYFNKKTIDAIDKEKYESSDNEISTCLFSSDEEYECFVLAKEAIGILKSDKRTPLEKIKAIKFDRNGILYDSLVRLDKIAASMKLKPLGLLTLNYDRGTKRFKEYKWQDYLEVCMDKARGNFLFDLVSNKISSDQLDKTLELLGYSDDDKQKLSRLKEVKEILNSSKTPQEKKKELEQKKLVGLTMYFLNLCGKRSDVISDGTESLRKSLIKVSLAEFASGSKSMDQINKEYSSWISGGYETNLLETLKDFNEVRDVLNSSDDLEVKTKTLEEMNAKEKLKAYIDLYKNYFSDELKKLSDKDRKKFNSLYDSIEKADSPSMLKIILESIVNFFVGVFTLSLSMEDLKHPLSKIKKDAYQETITKMTEQTNRIESNKKMRDNWKGL